MKSINVLIMCVVGFVLFSVQVSFAELSLPEKDKQAVFMEDIPAWQARLELARLLSYRERYDESVSQYRRVLEEKPDLIEARMELARVLFWKGDTAEAEAMFATIPEQDLPSDAKLELADIYLSREEYGKALDIYSDYLRIAPESHGVRLKKAQILSWQGNYDASLREYEIILNARPDDTEVRRLYAQVLIWAERFDDAIIELERAIGE
ncbi:MAG: tetratricopeptide repeat protein [Desulfonatronovibrio sp.]